MKSFIPGDPFAHRGTHRRPSTAARTAAKVTALAVPMALAGCAAVGATPLAAYTTPALSPAQSACAAFAAYERHPGAASLDALVTASFKLPHGYLAADVGLLYADSVTKKPGAVYVASDRRYVADDCSRH